MKTSELTRAALNWAVAICEGWEPVYVNNVLMLKHYHPEAAHTPHCYIEDFGYSTDWAQAGPIIERESIELGTNGVYHNERLQVESWCAIIPGVTEHVEGPTAQIAAMRCYVASKLGDEVEIPEELTKGE
jgi:hypothetical protein